MTNFDHLLPDPDFASFAPAAVAAEKIYQISPADCVLTCRRCLEAAVKERLRGKTPEGLGGAASAENAIKDQIAQNIRGGLN